MSDILDEEYKEEPEKELTTLKSMVQFEKGVEQYSFRSCTILMLVVACMIFAFCKSCYY